MKLFVTILSLFVLSGCATTETTGFIDPDYLGSNYIVSRVVVQVNGATMQETQIAEKSLVDKFKAYGVTAIRYTDLVPPTREYSSEKTANLIRRTGADSFLSISVGKSIAQSYLPPVYHPGSTTSHVRAIGVFSSVNTYSSPGYTSGGYTISSPVMASSSDLLDLKKGRKVWTAESSASGGESFSDLLISIGEDAIKDLAEKGLLSKNINKERATDTKNNKLKK